MKSGDAAFIIVQFIFSARLARPGLQKRAVHVLNA